VRSNQPPHLTAPRGAIVDARLPQVSGMALGGFTPEYQASHVADCHSCS
jgi:hypothetical protein